MTTEPTTACLMTAPARGGIAVIVLSGPRTGQVLGRVFRPRARVPGGEVLSLGRIVRDDETIDEAVVAFDSRAARAEINVHGGAQVGRAVLALLAECGAEVVPTARIDPAFARPADGLDNPAVATEALAALRVAATPLAVSAVTCQWSDGLSALARRMLDGPIDAACAGPLMAAAEGLTLMRRLLEPAEVVIAGPPNVGKSALANALVGRNVSIVSEEPGTTRDWVRTLIDVEGVPLWLTDTAGLWEAPDGVDAEAVRRAWRRIAVAELVLCVTAGPPGLWADLVARVQALPNVLNLSGKCDLPPIAPRGSGGSINPLLPEGAIEEEPRGHEGAPIAPLGSGGLDEAVPCGRAGLPLPVSGATFAGIEALRRAIRDRLGFADFDPRRPTAFTDRQAGALRLASQAARQGRPEDARNSLRTLLGG